MVTKLGDSTLRREISVNETSYIVAIDSTGLKITVKGRRKGLEMTWKDLISGDAALATALNASLDAESNLASKE